MILTNTTGEKAPGTWLQFLTQLPRYPHRISLLLVLFRSVEKDSLHIFPTGLNVKAKTMSGWNSEFLEKKNCREQHDIIIITVLTVSLEI